MNEGAVGSCLLHSGRQEGGGAQGEIQMFLLLKKTKQSLTSLSSLQGNETEQQQMNGGDCPALRAH